MPPKERLIDTFTAHWRPNSDIVYVFETEPTGKYCSLLGLYDKQVATVDKKFLYRRMTNLGDDAPTSGGGLDYAPWLFHDAQTKSWTFAPNYETNCVPMYQYTLSRYTTSLGTPLMDSECFLANPVKVTGCTTLLPPVEVMLHQNMTPMEVCRAAWKGCFSANPEEVAFSLFCRLMSASESYNLPRPNDRYAVERFDAERTEILAFFLMSSGNGCDDGGEKVGKVSDAKPRCLHKAVSVRTHVNRLPPCPPLHGWTQAAAQAWVLDRGGSYRRAHSFDFFL
ncbi:unnamed protein product [Discosporangium mesarthrocarpum]